MAFRCCVTRSVLESSLLELTFRGFTTMFRAAAWPDGRLSSAFVGAGSVTNSSWARGSLVDTTSFSFILGEDVCCQGGGIEKSCWKKVGEAGDAAALRKSKRSEALSPNLCFLHFSWRTKPRGGIKHLATPLHLKLRSLTTPSRGVKVQPLPYAQSDGPKSSSHTGAIRVSPSYWMACFPRSPHGLDSGQH